MVDTRGGPLEGIRVVEVGGIGPGPFAGMILADLGAEVIRVDRPGGSLPLPMPEAADLTNRGKRMVALDLKHPLALDAVLALADRADVLIESFRPGVAERLGFGPEVLHERNPRLVYGRMTGWGQDGPWAHVAGHDINYLATAGGLFPIGPRDGAPAIPLNLLGDFGGGSTYLVMGVLAALLDASASGRGQVVDAAIVDGVAHLLSGVHGFINAGVWSDARESNFLDGAAPYYRVYETADGRHVAVGAIEARFFAELCRVTGVSIAAAEQNDPRHWPAHHRIFERAFAARHMAEWARLFAGTDACVTPVPSVREAATHPHLVARGTFKSTELGIEPAPAPRFSRTAPANPASASPSGTHTRAVLEALGLDAEHLIREQAATQT